MNEQSLSVVVSNQLVRAVQNLSLVEKRLLMLGIAKVNADGINNFISIHAKEFAVTYNVSIDAAYKTLNKAELKLWARELSIDALNVKIRWLISVKYIDDTGALLLRFHPDLAPHVSSLKSRFTEYLLSRAAEFHHIYSWRLFELLMQFKKTGLLNISTEEFKKFLEVPEAYNRDWAIVRRKVLTPAVDEIREKTGLAVIVSTIKAGRKVKALKFTFPTEQQQKPATPPATPKRAKAKQAVSGSGITKSDAQSRLSGLKSMAALSGETIQSLASKSELAAFKEYELI